MADVFVSYSRRDAEFVRRLAEGLSERGKEAWVDIDGIRDAEVFPAALRAAIEESDGFVFVVSPASVASTYCAQEVEYALELNKRIVPLLLRPVDDHLVPEGVRVRNWVPFVEPAQFEDAVARVVDALDTDLAWAKEHTRWLLKALEWEGENRVRSFLLRGSELGAAESWLVRETDKEPAPTAVQREYVAASRAASTRRQRFVAGLSLAVAAVSIALLAFALISRAQARNAQAAAEAEALTSDARRVGTQALTETDLDRSFLLAVAGVKLKDLPETRGDLLAVLQDQPAVFRFLRPSRSEITALGVSPDGRLLASGDLAGTVHFDDLRTWKAKGSAVHLEGSVPERAIAFSPDGRTVAVATATAGNRSNLYLVDVASRTSKLIGSWPSIRASSGPLRFTRMAFSPDGTRIAVTVATATAASPIPVGERLLLLQTTNGRVVWQRRYPLRLGQIEAATVDFTPGGVLVTSAAHGDTVLWNARTGRIDRRFPIGGPFAVSPDGERAAVAENSANPGDQSALLAVLNLHSGRYRSLEALPARAWITALQFAPDGKSIVGASLDGALRVWAVASGSIVRPSPANPRGKTLPSFPPGTRSCRGPRTEVWRPGISPENSDWAGRLTGIRQRCRAAARPAS